MAEEKQALDLLTKSMTTYIGEINKLKKSWLAFEKYTEQLILLLPITDDQTAISNTTKWFQSWINLKDTFLFLRYGICKRKYHRSNVFSEFCQHKRAHDRSNLTFAGQTADQILSTASEHGIITLNQEFKGNTKKHWKRVMDKVPSYNAFENSQGELENIARKLVSLAIDLTESVSLNRSFSSVTGPLQHARIIVDVQMQPTSIRFIYSCATKAVCALVESECLDDRNLPKLGYYCFDDATGERLIFSADQPSSFTNVNSKVKTKAMPAVNTVTPSVLVASSTTSGNKSIMRKRKTVVTSDTDSKSSPTKTLTHNERVVIEEEENDPGIYLVRRLISGPPQLSPYSVRNYLRILYGILISMRLFLFRAMRSPYFNLKKTPKPVTLTVTVAGRVRW